MIEKLWRVFFSTDPDYFTLKSPRDIYYAKYYGKGGGNVQLGKKIKIRSQGKEKRRKITLT